MAEPIVTFVLQQLYQHVVEHAFNHVVDERTLQTGVDKNLNDIKDELESIQASLKDADTRAADDGGGADKEGVKIWVKQLREASFRIEDVIDKYLIYLSQNVNVNHSRFIALFQKIAHMFPNLKSKHQIADEIHDIKLLVKGINKRSAMFNFQPESGSSSSRGTKAARFGNPQMASHFIEEAQVVGFESPREELVNYLVRETNDRMLVSIVGMGGQGKSTLAKYVFDNQEVINHFDFRFFISVSQSYTMRDLLTDMIKKFYKDSPESIPKGLQEMDDNSLITHVRLYLKQKRYLMWFDDVRKEDFSDGIEDAMINNNNGSRILVTTRMKQAAEYFQRSFHVRIHMLKSLPQEKAWELFCNKAFRSQEGRCPTELQAISNEIVEKCRGLPMAVVNMAGLLSATAKTMSEWRKVSQNMIIELDRNAHLTSLTMILSRSYDDLPRHLKHCMLYFGMYPEHYTINCKRLMGQWIAEGFVKSEGFVKGEKRRTLEEVAEEYLKELIHTSLVQISSVGFDGKVKSCQVHDLLHHIITRKMKDLSFCHVMYEDHEQVTVGITRRFSIAACSSNVLRSNSNSGIRAIFVFDKGELPEYFIDSLSVKFELIKVLDFEHSLLKYVPENLGNLFHLKYLNLSHTKIMVLPISIGNLVNLEVLDLRQTQVDELPMEMNNLTKLRLLLVYYKKYEGSFSLLNSTIGVQMQKGIGCLKSLQNLYFLEVDHGGVDLIHELKKLRQLRKLGIRRMRQEYGDALCAATQKMKHLESLNITAIAENETLDLDFVSTPPSNIRVLNLKAKLTKLPDWIPKLQYLVKLMLGFSNFKHDPLDSLKNLPNLLRLYMWDDAFVGGRLRFQIGGFLKLKELDLTRLNKLCYVSIDKEALLCLEKFRFNNNPELKVLPQDLQHLNNLQFLGFTDMPSQLIKSIDRERRRQCHSIINHIPVVRISQKVGSIHQDYELHPFPTPSI